MQFDIIVAVDSKWGMCREGKLPWQGSPAGRKDMAWFKSMTTKPGTAVIMGRLTWESIPAKFRPLPDRVNIVISSKHTYTHSLAPASTKNAGNAPIICVNNFKAALEWCETIKISHCMVIGGKSVYEQALVHPNIRYAYITCFDRDYDCDMKFPYELMMKQNFVRLGQKLSAGDGYSIRRYNRFNSEEEEYLHLLGELIEAQPRPNRTGVTTRGLFSKMLKFNLYDPARGRILPLLTTKKVNWVAVYHELIWFLRASTDTSYLVEHDVKIWDGNSTREFLDKTNLEDYEEGEVGPIYGWQWRRWNQIYWPKHANKKVREGTVALEYNKGIDQLATVIETIKTDPSSRRLLVSAWNPEQLDEMALPPCHYAFQFHVDFEKTIVKEKVTYVPKYLNCLVDMRSADTFLGVPFNIASYALLTHMISQITGLLPGTLSLVMCDVHLYENAVEPAIKQIQRVPAPFPTLKFSDKILQKENPHIDDFAHEFTIDDYIVTDYNPQSWIKCDMVA